MGAGTSTCCGQQDKAKKCKTRMWLRIGFSLAGLAVVIGVIVWAVTATKHAKARKPQAPLASPVKLLQNLQSTYQQACGAGVKPNCQRAAACAAAQSSHQAMCSNLQQALREQQAVVTNLQKWTQVR